MGKFLEALYQQISIHVRQIAWLNSVAGGDRTRWDDMRARGIEPSLPECDAPHLVQYLFEIGPDHSSGPIPHTEIEAWQRNTATFLDTWESRAIRRLSVDYVSQSFKSRDGNCPAPDDELREQSRELGSRKFAEAMSSKFGRKK